jgi:DNA adenine methylase
MSGKLIKKIPVLQEVHKRFRTVNVENASWEAILNRYDAPDTVFYLDPPYMDTDQAACYGQHTMKHDEHRHLIDVIQTLKGCVVLSGYANPLYDSIEWDKRVTTNAYVSVGMEARKAEEVIWVKL